MQLIGVLSLIAGPLAGCDIIPVDRDDLGIGSVGKEHNAVPVPQIKGIFANLLWDGNGVQNALAVRIGILSGVGVAVLLVGGAAKHHDPVLAEKVLKSGGVCHGKLIPLPDVGLRKIKVGIPDAAPVVVAGGDLLLCKLLVGVGDDGKDPIAPIP